MRNYMVFESPGYAQDIKPDLGMSVDIKIKRPTKTGKSPIKIPYVPDIMDIMDKQNDLDNSRSQFQLKSTNSKSLHKTDINKMPEMQFTWQGSVSPKLIPTDQKRSTSRWERTHYPTPSQIISPIHIRNELPQYFLPLSPKNVRDWQVDKSQENQPPLTLKNKRISFASKEKVIGMGITAVSPRAKDAPAKTSFKNIPLLTSINEQKMPINEPIRISSAFSTSFPLPYEYADLNDNQFINRFISSTVSGSPKPPSYMHMDTISHLDRAPSRNILAEINRAHDFNRSPELCDFMVGPCKGEGRFGKVYMAIHRRTGMICALKKIKKESVQFIMDQFIQELKIQMFLNHPKLVKIYGYFVDREYFYMVVQYMEEGSLYSLMKKHKKFDERDAAEKLGQICQGIKEMHDRKIVHRDLKPENVVMSNGVCKICDFGWAAICQDRRQTYCGTLDYVCPEIAQGNAYDSGVDIWCIGVLAYELMCGKAPFYDISRQKTIEKIKSCKIDSFPEHLSRKAIDFVEMILKKEPDNRVGVHELLESEFLRSARK